MNITTLENTLYTWVYSITTTTPVIWLNQNGPRPEGGYVALKHNVFKSIGLNGYKAPPDINDIVKITDDIEFILMITGYEGTGKEAVFKVFEALKNPSKISSLSSNGIFYIDNQGILDVSELLDNSYEARAALDVNLRMANTIQYSPGVIETVNIDLTLNEEGVTKVEKTITVEQEE